MLHISFSSNMYHGDKLTEGITSSHSLYTREFASRTCHFYRSYYCFI